MFRQSHARKPAAKVPAQKSNAQGASQPNVQKPLRGCVVSYTGLSVQERVRGDQLQDANVLRGRFLGLNLVNAFKL